MSFVFSNVIKLDSIPIPFTLLKSKLICIPFQIFLSFIGVLNMLRGFFIFLVFIWKPSVWKMITKRHPWLVKALNFSTKCLRRRNNDILTPIPQVST